MFETKSVGLPVIKTSSGIIVNMNKIAYVQRVGSEYTMRFDSCFTVIKEKDYKDICEALFEKGEA